jgi:hypothetical protein
MQALVGAAYLFLNIAYWIIGLLPLSSSWDLSRYQVHDVTPEDAVHAHTYRTTSLEETETAENIPSFTRTLWYVIRETRAIAWIERSGATPPTPVWRKWAAEALEAARQSNRGWPATSRKADIVDELEL